MALRWSGPSEPPLERLHQVAGAGGSGVTLRERTGALPSAAASLSGDDLGRI